MNRIFRSVLSLMCLILTASIISSCGRVKDENNANVAAGEEINSITGCDIYYCTGINMAEYIDNANYRDIVYAASSVARDTWYDGENRIYTVGETIQEVDMNFLNGGITDLSSYYQDYGNELKKALRELSTDRLNLIFTDMQSELYDYSTLSELFVNNALKKNMSIGFIGIQLDQSQAKARTFFIIAIADTANLSKYISNFKSNPTIISYSGEMHDFQMDTVQMINYQIIANKSGIEGINYKDVSFIENGYYAGEDGNIDRQETQGSFTNANDKYDYSQIDTIEGTVNFSPNYQQFVTVKNSPAKKSTPDNKDKKEKKERKSDNRGKDTPINKPMYLGVKPLVNQKSDAAGKIKLNVPFNVISGVKLSKIDCDIVTKGYISGSGKFSKKELEETNVTVKLADGATPEQGKWRVNDKDNSVVLNIMVPKINDLPIHDKDVLKLDITFNHKDTMNSVSRWVIDWDRRGCSNLINFFNSLYTFQQDANNSENTLTVYIALDERANKNTKAKFE